MREMVVAEEIGNWLTEEDTENLSCEDPKINRDLRDSSAMRDEI